MTHKVLYFSWIKEKTGAAEEEFDLPASVTTVSDLIDWLKDQSPGHDEAFADLSQIRVAVDQTHEPFEAQITSASEIAFFPPVTGG